MAMLFCVLHTLKPKQPVRRDSSLCWNRTHFLGGEMEVGTPTSLSLPCTSFSPPLFHPSSLPNMSPSFICIPLLLIDSLPDFLSDPLLPPLTTPPSPLVWNKTALSPLLLSVWPSAPWRIFFWLPQMKVFVYLEHKHSLTFHSVIESRMLFTLLVNGYGCWGNLSN